MTTASPSPKVALVTGASSGMGKDFALRLKQDGLIVYAAARRVEQMADLEAAGIHTLRMDITKPEEVEAAVAGIEAAHGAVDVLINNAGFGLFGAVEDIPIDDARYQFEVNLFGLAYLTQKVLPAMRARGAGKIINISSMGGRIYTPLGAWYHATKHALEGWSDCLRLELAAHGIQVVVIQPGMIRTSFGDVLSGPMLKYSGEGPYAPLARAIAAALDGGGAKTPTSPPSVVTEAVSRAVRLRRPRTRYVAGATARPLMFLRKHLGDRVFDWLMLRAAR